MSSDSSDYHRLELSIATNPNDSRRVMPPVETKHRRILDIGCGAGQTLIGSNLADHVLAVGVDVDRSALALGKQLNTAIHFVEGRGEALPFKSDAFDLVICRVSLPYMRVSSALSEISRVTDVGGDLWLVLHPFGMTVKELGSSLARFQVKASLYRLWVLLNGFALNTTGRQWHWPGDPDRYETWQANIGITRTLRAAGFGEIHIDRANHFVVRATKKHKTYKKNL